jgi:phosphopantothenoylcysteine decarboxylase/phosphopantothenate--cysteine ligase
VTNPWKGKRVLITSGPTREHLDPIRFMTNASSGRMGFALAAEAARMGARVTVVSGPTAETPPRGIRVVPVVTGLEMHRRTLALARAADAVIGAAAVSDWRFASASAHKIKRRPGALRLTLIPNPDIIKDLARRRGPGQLVVGFALETRDAVKSARSKLVKKGLDLVVANGPASLSSGRMKAILVTRSGAKAAAGTKQGIAKKILNEMAGLWRAKNS